MALFNSIFENYTDDSLNYIGSSTNSDITTDVMIESICDFDTEMFQLEAALYIVDSQIETSVFEGASIHSVENVLENALTDFIDTVKKKITELWRKFVDFVTKIRSNVISFFATSNNYVSKKSGEISNKIKKIHDYEYKYTGWIYYEEEIDKGIKVLNDLDKIKIASNEDNASVRDQIFYSYMGKVFDSKHEVNDIHGLVSAYYDACRGERVNDHSPDAEELEEWVKRAKDSKSTIKSINDATNAAKRHFQDAHKTLDKARREADKNKNESSANAIRQQAKWASQLASGSSKFGTAVLHMYVEYIKAITARLKAFLAAPKKDGVKESSYMGYYSSDSLLSSAFDML